MVRKLVTSLAVCSTSLMILNACSASQVSSAEVYATAICNEYNQALADDPALATHNPKYAKAGAMACAAAPGLISGLTKPAS